MELEHFSHDHKLLLNEKNNLNPDEEISCLCFICSLPIFSTLYYSCSGAGCNNFFIHKRCAHLPKRLKHVSRGDFRARVVTDDEFEFSCDKCGRKCDNVIWTPATRPAPIGHLDAFCAAPLELRVFHGSHEHVMVPVLGEDFFVCGACGLKHEERIRFRDEDEERIRSSIFYWCCWCSLWIHEHCATLPNYIRHVEHHDHPLALTYALPREDQYSYCCGICGDSITSWGIYFCGTCSYYTHIKCATHRSELYKPVSSLEIGESGYWAQFPMANEDRSLVAYILDKTRHQNKEESSTNISSKHEHPLIFHATSNNLGRSLCNGCIQPISAPHYSCSQCTNYLLHESCANLPPSILHPAHAEHPLVLLTNYNKSGFGCSGCWFECNGFSYRCERCDFELDVQCAFLPKSITHKAHDKRHIFHLIYVLNQRKSLNADCCGTDRIGEFQYICTGCDFLIHGFCAGLPLSVRHKYDKHPLKLIIGRPPITSDHRDNYFEEHKSDITTTTKQQQSYADHDENFCEFCEKKIYNKHWYYDCAECNQSFHVECIPTVSKKSKFKLQARLNIPCHPHPLKGIRLLTDVSRSYRCGYCGDTIKNFEDELVFECLECDFTIHDDCALRNLCAKDKTC